ncbi:lipopolysaccharide export LptBFGC system permease protein LptF [Cryobacterium sp. MP_3.1]|uniref:hypothetical protein n=1 Tax=Cryobacterium sp. MP_3.1 TaxID=3071711 RepID=UPI002E0CA87E|nr:lipopolysaccharide export LptBFGC system permease protein LptF [Cryobacterium sp. MP_3.1]
MIAWIPFIVVVAFVGGFTVSAWSPRFGAARDRLALATDGLAAAGILFASRALVDWTSTTVFAWYALVLLLAVAAVGAVLRWRSLPPLKDPTKRTRRTVGAGFAAVVILGLVAVTNL